MLVLKPPEAPADEPPKRNQIASAGLPEIPDELIEACAEKECILFGGYGLGAQAGYPTWPGALLSLIQGFYSPGGERESMERTLAAYKVDVVTDVLLARVPRSDLIQRLGQIYGAVPQNLPSLFESLRAIPFAAALTTHCRWSPPPTLHWLWRK